ncbi:hypothetical protein ScPMuIL_000123 [Solemya velum]
MAFYWLWTLLYVVGRCFNPTSGEVLSPELKDEVNMFVNDVLACRKISGLTLAVVKSEETWIKGYGKADMALDRAVDADTQFLIGSLTKAFTALAIGMLLKESTKGYNWDTPVVDILGDNYRFIDNQRTSFTTIKDLLTHRTPMANPDIVGFSGYPMESSRRQELCKRLRFIPEKLPFRDRWFYNNFAYMYVGCIIEKLAGQSWEEVIKTRLLEPIGMTSTHVEMDNIFQLPNIALPYYHGNNTILNGNKEIYKLSPLEPAGSILSNGKDMVKWAKFLLKKGVTDTGQSLVTEDIIDEMMATHIDVGSFGLDISKPKFPVSETITGYGHAWFQAVYRGYRRVDHSGGVVSYVSRIWLFNEMEAAIFMSVNMGGNDISLIQKSILYFLSDKLLNLDPWLNTTTACSYPAPWMDPKNRTINTLPDIGKEPKTSHIIRANTEVTYGVTSRLEHPVMEVSR